MSRKFALVIGTSEYADRRLSRLASPQADVARLSEVLAASDLGQFDEVKTLVNRPHEALLKEMWRFVGGDKRTDDFVLVYYSGHGVKDEQGKLYLACPDTDVDLLRATAIPASDLTDSLDQCRARRQVLILDCCNSGAFRNTKGVMGETVGTKDAFSGNSVFRGEGQGRVILTATDATQYAMEGDDLLGEAQPSVFTHHLLEGLRTGDADQNGDGWIGVDELYDYVHWRVVQETPRQQPCKFADDVRGEFVIARRPRGTEKPVPLSDTLVEDLRSTAVPTRLAAVEELAIWLAGAHIGRVLAAIAALRQVVASDDSNRVRARAQQVLDEHRDAVERALSSTPDRITVLTQPSHRHAAEPTPAQPVAPRPAAVEAVPARAAPPAEDVGSAWIAWALRESHGDHALASAGAAAAMSAASAGADSTGAAEAGRREIARLRAAAAAAAPAPVAPAPVAPAPVAAAPYQPPAAAPTPQAPAWQPNPSLPAGQARPPEAMVALVLGILSLVTCGIILGPIAIWYGRRGQQRIRESAGQLGGASFASAGIWLGVVGIVLYGGGLLIWFLHALDGSL